MEISKEQVLLFIDAIDSVTVSTEEKLYEIRKVWEYSCETGKNTLK